MRQPQQLRGLGFALSTAMLFYRPDAGASRDHPMRLAMPPSVRHRPDCQGEPDPGENQIHRASAGGENHIHGLRRNENQNQLTAGKPRVQTAVVRLAVYSTLAARAAQRNGMDLRDAKLAFLDVETTGLSPAMGDRVVEVGIVVCRGDQEVDRILGDVQAVKRGRVGRRIGRRVAGKATGRLFMRLFG